MTKHRRKGDYLLFASEAPFPFLVVGFVSFVIVIVIVFTIIVSGMFLGIMLWKKSVSEESQDERRVVHVVELISSPEVYVAFFAYVMTAGRSFMLQERIP